MSVLSGTRFRAASWLTPDAERFNEFLSTDLGRRAVERLESLVPLASDPRSRGSEAHLFFISGCECILRELVRLGSTDSTDETLAAEAAKTPAAAGPKPIAGYPSLDADVGWPADLRLKDPESKD